jgi:hypothetical protein
VALIEKFRNETTQKPFSSFTIEENKEISILEEFLRVSEGKPAIAVLPLGRSKVG